MVRVKNKGLVISSLNFRHERFLPGFIKMENGLFRANVGVLGIVFMSIGGN